MAERRSGGGLRLPGQLVQQLRCSHTDLDPSQFVGQLENMYKQNYKSVVYLEI